MRKKGEMRENTKIKNGKEEEGSGRK